MEHHYQHIQSKTNNNVLSILLDRPLKRNALHPAMISEIQHVLETYKDSESIRVVLISSTSSVFSAGADIKYLEKMLKFSYEENLLDSQKLMNLLKTMLSYPKLIIAKIVGPAIAGGCGLVTASDITFSEQHSIFGYPEVKIGFVPALVSSLLMSKINGTQMRDLLLTGKTINAQEAHSIGLINYVCDQKSINTEINTFIKKFCTETSPNSIKITKEIIYLSQNLEAKLEEAAKINAKSRMDDDFKKGVTAFLKKQTINWGKKK